MAPPSSFSAHDIRGPSVDYKRATESKHKWHNGEVWGPGRSKGSHGRPVRMKSKLPRSNKELGVHEAKTVQRHEIIDETLAPSDSSCDEEPIEPSAAPDVDIVYSFDKAGPSHGSQILTLALERAVERFEDNQTDKIVKEEYEILDYDGEPVRSPPKKAQMHIVSEEADYEFV
ncbi:hypothetical protein EJ06DRAFT_534328 [Trichodelitschia bisporula]|uniref:Uncharacterized protein n=1 Tax=Trichodelitschia bisporula TaxID=703511 RepID=A0A6G1HJW3_9PEZI|nr:hypothetical protein EJ06DRAFT_534328 [Trichodelitschia bisporula]